MFRSTISDKTAVASSPQRNLENLGSYYVKVFLKRTFSVLFLIKKKKKLNVSTLGYISRHLSRGRSCPHTLFSQTMWQSSWGIQCDTDNVICTAVHSCSPCISIIEPGCYIVGSLSCNASAVYSACWGAAWQFQLSTDTLEGIST